MSTKSAESSKSRFDAGLEDLLAVVGAGLVSYGAWLVYAPIGYIAAGSLMLYAALLRGRAQALRGGDRS